MMDKRAFLLCSSVALLAGCSSVSVNLDFDSTVDFSTLHTYAWQHEEQPETGNPRIDNDLNNKRIRRAIDAELQAKGFVEAEKASASFQVVYYMNFERRIDNRGGGWSIGMSKGSTGRAGGVGWSSGSNVSDYEEAQLTIDIINPATEQMIWRGRGRRSVSGNSTNPEKLTARTNDAVARILKKFPPTKK
ncbi:MAG: DUF4136 domain-containing protein [Kiritimatiellaceae bacterium]|nr:DUF4136 domain-containing protein [Kiritimatiellaceae bacterium]